MVFEKVGNARLLTNAWVPHLEEIFYNQVYHNFLIQEEHDKQQHF